MSNCWRKMADESTASLDVKTPSVIYSVQTIDGTHVVEEITDKFDPKFDVREEYMPLCLLVLCSWWTAFPLQYLLKFYVIPEQLILLFHSIRCFLVKVLLLASSLLLKAFNVDLGRFLSIV